MVNKTSMKSIPATFVLVNSLTGKFVVEGSYGQITQSAKMTTSYKSQQEAEKALRRMDMRVDFAAKQYVKAAADYAEKIAKSEKRIKTIKVALRDLAKLPFAQSNVKINRLDRELGTLKYNLTSYKSNFNAVNKPTNEFGIVKNAVVAAVTVSII